jgi:outer membrane protein
MSIHYGADAGRRLRENSLKIAFLILAPLLVLYANTSAAQVQSRIGYVNLERIMKDSPLAIRAQKKLEAEFGKRDQELGKLSDQLKRMQDNLEKNAVTMSESERTRREREFNDLTRDFQRKQREAREDFNQRRNEELSGVIERANRAVKLVAETDKLDVVIQEAVWASPRIDITDKVIKLLDDSSKAAK